MRTLRASASTTSTRRRRRRLGSKRSALRAAKNMSERSRAKRRSTPGRNSLTATSRSPSLVAHARAMHLRDRGGGDGVAEFDEDVFDLGAEGRLDRRDRDGAVRRRHAVLQLFEFQHHLGADDVGARGEKLSELDVGGTEPIDRGGKAAEAVRAAPRQQIGEGQRRPGERRQRQRIDADEGALARQHEAGARQARRRVRWRPDRDKFRASSPNGSRRRRPSAG